MSRAGLLRSDGFSLPQHKQHGASTNTTSFRSPWNDLFGWRPDYYAASRRDELSTQTCEEVTSFAGVFSPPSLQSGQSAASGWKHWAVFNPFHLLKVPGNRFSQAHGELELEFNKSDGTKILPIKMTEFVIYVVYVRLGRQVAGQEIPISPFDLKKMMKSYWDALKTDINTCTESCVEGLKLDFEGHQTGGWAVLLQIGDYITVLQIKIKHSEPEGAWETDGVVRMAACCHRWVLDLRV